MHTEVTSHSKILNDAQLKMVRILKTEDLTKKAEDDPKDGDKNVPENINDIDTEGCSVDEDKGGCGTSTSRKGAKVNNMRNKGIKKEALDATQFENLRSKLGVCIFEEP